MNDTKYITKFYQTTMVKSVIPMDQQFYSSRDETTSTSTAKMNIEPLNNDANNPYPDISWMIALTLLQIFLISPCLSNLLVGFFQNQPMQKQCVMNTLYQDVIQMNQLLVWCWTMSGLIIQQLSAIEQATFILMFAKYMVVVQEALALAILLYLCLIGGLRLYTIKFSVLDPTTDYWEVSDYTAIRIIRSSLGIFVAAVIVILCITSTRPLVYFQILQKTWTLSDLPTSTFILLSVDAGLICICVGLLITGNIYQKWEDAKTIKELIELEIQLNKSFEMSNFTNSQSGNTAQFTASWFGNTKSSVNDTLRIQIDAPSKGVISKPYSVHHFTLPTLLFLVNGIMTLSLLLIHTFNIMNFGFWWAMTLFLTNQGFLIPLILILYNHPIRSYSTRSIQYHLEYMFGSMQRITSTFCRRDLRKIIPTSDQQI